MNGPQLTACFAKGMQNQSCVRLIKRHCMRNPGTDNEQVSTTVIYIGNLFYIKYHAPSLDMTLLHHRADFGTNVIYHGGRSAFAVKHEIL